MHPKFAKKYYEIRNISKRISPMFVYGETFLSSIQEHIQSLGFKKLIDIEIIPKNIPEFDNNKHHLIYRILQELIQNTIKHSKATELKIEFSVYDNAFIIRTSDNGIGYSTRNLRKNKGMGLKSIQHIISELGGELHKSGPEYKGTKYNFKIPIQHETK